MHRVVVTAVRTGAGRGGRTTCAPEARRRGSSAGGARTPSAPRWRCASSAPSTGSCSRDGRPALAAHYPSVGGREGPDLAATFLADGRGARVRDRDADRGRGADQRGGSLGRAGGRVRDRHAPHLPPAAHPRGGGQRRPEPAMGPLRLRHRASGLRRSRQPGALRRACGRATRRIFRPASRWSSDAGATATPSTPPRRRDASP